MVKLSVENGVCLHGGSLYKPVHDPVSKVKLGLWLATLTSLYNRMLQDRNYSLHIKEHDFLLLLILLQHFLMIILLCLRRILYWF